MLKMSFVFFLAINSLVCYYIYLNNNFYFLLTKNKFIYMYVQTILRKSILFFGKLIVTFLETIYI